MSIFKNRFLNVNALRDQVWRVVGVVCTVAVLPARSLARSVTEYPFGLSVAEVASERVAAIA